jgi:hypothetical protein
LRYDCHQFKEKASISGSVTICVGFMKYWCCVEYYVDHSKKKVRPYDDCMKEEAQ